MRGICVLERVDEFFFGNEGDCQEHEEEGEEADELCVAVGRFVVGDEVGVDGVVEFEVGEDEASLDVRIIFFRIRRSTRTRTSGEGHGFIFLVLLLCSKRSWRIFCW